MKLTIELDDQQLEELKCALQIHENDFNAAAIGATDIGNATMDYAYRILRARKALDLSVSDQTVIIRK